jgi:hypothetical protein
MLAIDVVNADVPNEVIAVRRFRHSEVYVSPVGKIGSILANSLARHWLGEWMRHGDHRVRHQVRAGQLRKPRHVSIREGSKDKA